MKKLILFILIVQGSHLLSAQGKLQLNASISFPNDGFAFEIGDLEDNLCNASDNLGLGLKYFYPLKWEATSLVFSMNIYGSTLNNYLKGQLDNLIEESTTSKFEVDCPWFVNIPLMVGLNHEFLKLTDGSNARIFGEAGVGVNFYKISKYRIYMEHDDINAESTIKTECPPGLCGKIEGGIVFGNRYSFSLSYTYLGQYPLKITSVITSNSTYLERDPETEEFKTSIALLNLTFGYRF